MMCQYLRKKSTGFLSSPAFLRYEKIDGMRDAVDGGWFDRAEWVPARFVLYAFWRVGFGRIRAYNSNSPSKTCSALPWRETPSSA